MAHRAAAWRMGHVQRRIWLQHASLSHEADVRSLLVWRQVTPWAEAKLLLCVAEQAQAHEVHVQAARCAADGAVPVPGGSRRRLSHHAQGPRVRLVSKISPRRANYARRVSMSILGPPCLHLCAHRWSRYRLLSTSEGARAVLTASAGRQSASSCTSCGAASGRRCSCESAPSPWSASTLHQVKFHAVITS